MAGVMCDVGRRIFRDMKTMAGRWCEFERAAVKPGMSQDEVLRLKLAFYTGGALLLECMREAGKSPDGGAELLSLTREMAATITEVMGQQAEKQAKAAGPLQ
jgi:hypothetical protein